MKHLLITIFLIIFGTGVLSAQDKTTKLEIMTIEFSDVVMKITEGSSSSEVLFKKHAARYKLLKTAQEYSKILQSLNESAKLSKNITVSVDPTKLEIIKALIK